LRRKKEGRGGGRRKKRRAPPTPELNSASATGDLFPCALAYR